MELSHWKMGEWNAQNYIIDKKCYVCEYCAQYTLIWNNQY